jgi:hypothetical protein
MCLHAARLPGRLDSSGDLRSLFDQDRSRWNPDLVAEGQRLLDLSASSPDLTEYHVEAAIAFVHTTAQRAEDTDWEVIVSLYDRLMAIRPSPVVALNRAIAIAQRDGQERGLEEIRAILTWAGSPGILSITLRSVSSSFAAGVLKLRANTCGQRWRSRAILWRGIFSSSALARATEAISNRYSGNGFWKRQTCLGQDSFASYQEAGAGPQRGSDHASSYVLPLIMTIRFQMISLASAPNRPKPSPC